MTYQRWSTIDHHDELGVIVHGPAIVARSAGIAVAVRSVVAHTDGIVVDIVLRANGVQAEAAVRQTFGRDPAHHRDHAQETSQPAVVIETGGHRINAFDYGESSSEGGDDHFDSTTTLGVDILPPDGRLTVTASWPEAGLAEGSVTLDLAIPDDLESRTLRLL